MNTNLLEQVCRFLCQLWIRVCCCTCRRFRLGLQFSLSYFLILIGALPCNFISCYTDINAGPTLLVSVPLLCGANDYPTWKHSITMIWLHKDFRMYVEGRVPDPAVKAKAEAQCLEGQTLFYKHYLAPNMIRVVRNVALLP